MIVSLYGCASITKKQYSKKLLNKLREENKATPMIFDIDAFYPKKSSPCASLRNHKPIQ